MRVRPYAADHILNVWHPRIEGEAPNQQNLPVLLANERELREDMRVSGSYMVSRKERYLANNTYRFCMYYHCNNL